MAKNLVCSVDGCGKVAESRGYCWMHYMRLHRHGSVDAGRPDWYGTKSSHPMYITWMSAKRQKNLCDAWHQDFWKFLEDVSPIPDGDWRLRRKDRRLPYSKENVFWRETQFSMKKYGEEELREVRNESRKSKARADHDPAKHRIKSLRQNHGLTVEEYDKLHAAQEGVCAICGKPERKVGSTGKVLPLAVDHYHKTRQSGKSKGIRGLLCQACNIGLGKFDDDPELLLKAAAYLEKYRQ